MSGSRDPMSAGATPAGGGMKRLMILRHAKAERAALGDMSDAADHARVLDPRGRDDARALGASNAFEGHLPELILVSTSARTRETLAALGRFGDVETRAEEALYLAEPTALRQALARVPETASAVLLIGHNPGLHELCRELAEDPFGDATPRHLARAARLDDGLPTCAMVVFALHGFWSQLADPDVHAALVDLRTPA